jgi:hypothetical protein
VLHLEIVEFLLVLADDLVDLVANRRRIDLDAIVDLRQFSEQRLGDLAVGRDDDFAGFEFTTSSGIFSPSSMLLRASVSCSRNSSILPL